MTDTSPASPPARITADRTRCRLGEFLSPITPPKDGCQLIPVLPRFERLPALPQSVSRARRIAHQMLSSVGAACASLADTAALLTSELVSNAVVHGPSGEDHCIELTIWHGDAHWWIAVADAGELLPTPRTPSPTSEGGRGLLLITSLAANWGVLPRPTTGKAVYVSLAEH